MATTHVAFGKIDVVGGGGVVPVMRAATAQSTTTLTPSASNQQSQAQSGGADSDQYFARIATDTQIYAAAGANPDATTAANRIMIPAGGVEYVAVSKGDKIAIVTAP